MSNVRGSDKSSDAERTGKDADKNREQLAKNAQKGIRDAVAKPPKDQA